jgi:hypothetical protein
MAMTPWVARGTLTTTTTTTLYTVTDPEIVIVTNIVLTNRGTVQSTVTLDIDSVYVVYGLAIPVGEVVTLDLKQPIITSGSNKLIRGGAADASTIDFHVAGVTS